MLFLGPVSRCLCSFFVCYCGDARVVLATCLMTCVGMVTSLQNIPAVRVSMGRTHTCVLTKMGTVYTFGNNQYGQCGRNYHPPSEGMHACMCVCVCLKWNNGSVDM